MITPKVVPTPASVAGALADIGGEDEEQWAWSAASDGAVIALTITPRDEGDVAGSPVAFRAVVVEGGQLPIVLDQAAYERLVNERFTNMIARMLGVSLVRWPAHVAMLHQQIIDIDADLPTEDGPPPIVLARPADPETGSDDDGPELSVSDGWVHMAYPGGMWLRLPPNVALRFAARLAALAEQEATVEPERPSWDDGTCGDCESGRCHGGDPEECGCARHAASVTTEEEL